MSNVKGKNRLHPDQYYTPPELAEYCIAKTYEVIGANNIKSVIEPSAGSIENEVDLGTLIDILDYQSCEGVGNG